MTAAVLAAGSALAADLQVTPISVEIGAQEQSQAMVLSNTGKAVLRAQIRVHEWSQVDGLDKLTLTRDVIASPPVVEVAPQGQQMVRIVRLLPAPAQEKTYRLIIDELPGSGPAAPAAGGGLQFLLRYSVPVFVLPLRAGDSPAQDASRAGVAPADTANLSASVRADASGTALLSVVNKGLGRAKIAQLVHVDGAGQRTPLYPGLVGYVLAGQTMSWPLRLPLQTLQSGVLKAKFNDDQDEQTLPFSVQRP